MTHAQLNCRIAVLKTTYAINALEVTLIPTYVRTLSIFYAKAVNR